MIVDLAFWYGIGFSEFEKMPLGALEVYLERLPARKASLQKMISLASRFPYLKGTDQRSELRSLDSMIYRDRQPAKVARPAMLIKSGIGFRMHKKTQVGDVSTETPDRKDKSNE